MTCANMFFRQRIDGSLPTEDENLKNVFAKIEQSREKLQLFFQIISDNIFSHACTTYMGNIYLESRYNIHRSVAQFRKYTIFPSIKMLIPVISHFFFAKSMKHVKRKLIFICLLKWFKRVFHLAQHCNFMDFCCKN